MPSGGAVDVRSSYAMLTMRGYIPHVSIAMYILIYISLDVDSSTEVHKHIANLRALLDLYLYIGIV